MKKRVLITGGTSGMGLSAAGLFLKRGWQVLMAGRDQVKGEELKSGSSENCVLQMECNFNQNFKHGKFIA